MRQTLDCRRDPHLQIWLFVVCVPFVGLAPSSELQLPRRPLSVPCCVLEPRALPTIHHKSYYTAVWFSVSISSVGYCFVVLLRFAFCYCVFSQVTTKLPFFRRPRALPLPQSTLDLFQFSDLVTCQRYYSVSLGFIVYCCVSCCVFYAFHTVFSYCIFSVYRRPRTPRVLGDGDAFHVEDQGWGYGAMVTAAGTLSALFASVVDPEVADCQGINTLESLGFGVLYEMLGLSSV